MKEDSGLFGVIADEYGIERGNSESLNEWHCRILYSLSGRMACASLRDSKENDNEETIIHMKKRIQKILDAYIKMYPELKPFFENYDYPDLCSEICSIFEETGQVYHRPERIIPAKPCAAEVDGYYFLRGTPSSCPCFLSGLGCYSNENLLNVNPVDLLEMYQISSKRLDERLKELLLKINWKTIGSGLNIKYLKTEPEFTHGYWDDNADKTGQISLMRTGEPGEYIYYFYKWEDMKFLYSALPSWLTEKHLYRYISNSILYQRKTLPAIYYQNDGAITRICLNYLPPSEELNFLRLYSWPVRYTDFPCDFKRIISADVFNAVKPIFESLGYSFKEVI